MIFEFFGVFETSIFTFGFSDDPCHSCRLNEGTAALKQKMNFFDVNFYLRLFSKQQQKDIIQRRQKTRTSRLNFLTRSLCEEEGATLTLPPSSFQLLANHAS